ncbi:hypothetical protein [Vibrio sp. 10N.286.46.E10]|uniref:hypothetical protein n=1 Tax=unclassified Vibrio TaxID=2614977 RepID=UPI000D3A3096|nr:hypothetical protein [Vibrio sp. 10N.286.46.E10]PTQ15023.1 hypothetical protein CWO24_24460 [Vibrio sp. 10N.286.46.E10]
MPFSSYLKTKLNDNDFSSKSIIAKLQLFSSSFDKLDPVTLSRWVNGRTIPTLEKQLLVVRCFDSSFYPNLEHIIAPAVSRSQLKVYESLFNNVESSYHSILTYKEASDSRLKPSIEKVNWSKLQCLLPGFYESTLSYNRALPVLNRLDENNVTFCSLRSRDKVISHLSISHDINYLKAIFGHNVNIDFDKESVVFNIGYYSNREHYKILVGLLLNHICYHHEKIEDFYVIARGMGFLKLIESFGGKLLSANKEDNAIGNVYLLKMDFMRAITNPFAFSLLKESYGTYKDIN